ncbi:MAG: response regulator [Thioalkalivibrionaceae bacterium]
MSESLVSSSAVSRSRILICDDSKVIRIALRRILAEQYPLVEAADGAEGWTRLSEQADIGLVLTDLSMPEVDGLELLDRIRGEPGRSIGLPPDLPVVIVTGQEGEQLGQEALIERGANRVLNKPFEQARVRELVASLLAPPSHAPEPSVDDELAGARAEIQRLKSELMLRQQSPSERELQFECLRLRKVIGDTRDETTAAIARAELAEGEVSRLRAQIEDLQGGRDRKRGDDVRLQALEADVVRLDHEVLELTNERDALRGELATRSEAASRAERERDEARRMAGQHAAAVSELSSQLERERGQRMQAAEHLAEIERQLESSRAERLRLESALEMQRRNAAERQTSSDVAAGGAAARARAGHRWRLLLATLGAGGVGVVVGAVAMRLFG